MSSAQQLRDLFSSALHVGRVDSIDKVKRTVWVTYLTSEGHREFDIPTISSNPESWIRSGIEPGALVLIAQTRQATQPEILKVFSLSEQARMALNKVIEIEAEADSTQKTSPPIGNLAVAQLPETGLPFRELQSGEHEAVSNGRAEWFLSSFGDFHQRGGVARSGLQSYSGKSFGLAAAFERRGLDSSLTALDDTEYFGVVVRPIDSTTVEMQKILDTQQILNEIQANQADTSQLEAKLTQLLSELTTSQTAYTVSLNQLAKATQQAINAQLANTIQALTQLIKPALALKELGTVYGYQNLAFESKLAALMDQLVELKELGSNAKAGELKVTAINLPSFGLDQALKDQTAFLDSQTQKAQATLDQLLQAAKVKAEDVIDSKYVHPSYVLKDGFFAKEYRARVSWKGSPHDLWDKQAGHVFDDGGKEVLNPLTGVACRSRERFFSSNGATVIFVDANGNVSHILSPDATKGYQLYIPKGSFHGRIGKDLDLDIEKDGRIHVHHNLAIQADRVIRVAAEAIELMGKRIKLAGDVVEIEAQQMLKEKAPAIFREGTASIVDKTPSYSRG